MINITSDFKNFSKLMCNLADTGYIVLKEIFRPVIGRSFYSKDFKRTNLVIENGISEEDIRKASSQPGGSPCLSVANFEKLIRILKDGGFLKNTNPDAKDVEEMFDKLNLSYWTGTKGESKTPMVSVYDPAKKVEKPEPPKVDKGLEFLTKPIEEFEKAKPAQQTQATPQATVVTQGQTDAVNPDEVPPF